MEIKEGMYVRTRYGIAKIERITSMYYELDRNIMLCNLENYLNCCTNSDILGEPSFNIIDVIQENDLVELTSKYCEDEVYRVIYKFDDSIGLDCLGEGSMSIKYDKDIKRVLTKEQFAAMAYEVNND